MVVVAAAAALVAAAPEEFSTSAGALRLTPIQHASLMIQAGGKVLYVDPAEGSYDRLPQADIILITDIHSDHMNPALVGKLRKPATVILAPKAVGARVRGCTVKLAVSVIALLMVTIRGFDPLFTLPMKPVNW